MRAGTTASTKRCVIYSRVSTDAQERDGTSLETQERACIDYAREAALHVVDEVRDAASGFSLERTGLVRLRDLAARGEIDVIVAYALDRLSRKQTHVAILVEEMEDRGVTIEFVTEKFEDTATGQLLRSVKAFAAELEREKIVERTMRGKAERARSGRLPQATGRGLYGYRYDPITGRREIEPKQATIVRRVFASFVDGDSISGIARSLNEAAIPTQQGKQWYGASVFHLLQNAAYSGRTTYRKTKAAKARDPLTGLKRRRVTVRPPDEWIDVPGATPAIVSAEQFDAAQTRLRDPERLRHGRRKSTYGLAGRIRCIQCGSAMVGQTLQGRYRYYRCRRAFAGATGDRCNSRYVRSDKLEAALLGEVAEMLSRPEIVYAELERRSGQDEAAMNRRAAIARLESLERQRVRLVKLYTLGEIDDGYLNRELAQIQADRQSLTPVAESVELSPSHLPSRAELDVLCGEVRSWLLTSGSENLPLVAQALQLSIHAGTERSDVSGLIPEYAPTCEHADVRGVVGARQRHVSSPQRPRRSR